MRGVRPLSLSIRIYLIVMGGVVLALFLSHVLLERERSLHIEDRATRRANHHISDVALLLSALPAADRPHFLKTLPNEVWQFDTHQNLAPPVGLPNPRLRRDVGEALKGKALVESAWTEPRLQCGKAAACPLQLGVQLIFPDDQKLVLIFRSTPEKTHSRPLLPLIRDRYLPFILVMALVSWWVVRLALRPIDRMRDAMADFGRDITRPALPLDGPIELRRTFETFNQMQDQIRAFMTERTDMLAAITHDLKTPLTRMRLRLEDVSEIDTKKKLQDDLLFMQRLIDEGLELAKSHHSSEPQREIELTFLIQSLCDDLADAGHDVQFEDSGFRSGMLVYAQAFCLRRIFENLLDNAIKYGMRARVRVRETPTYIYVTIEDDGPGIPESQIAGVLDPFVRLENSRSRETGGTGLGLAIASNLVQAQGGVLHLRNREHGGLEVEVILNRLKRMASD